MLWTHLESTALLSRTSDARVIQLPSSSQIADVLHLEREINEDIEFAVFKIGSYNKKVSQCLCHGTFGNVQILKYWAKKSGNLRLLKKYQIWEEQNNSISNMEDLPLPQEKYSFGFMNGAVGVAYEKLREIDDSLP